CQHYYSTPNSF
nr:immunoglobulin light chain junction region [Macaca mulatta]